MVDLYYGRLSHRAIHRPLEEPAPRMLASEHFPSTSLLVPATSRSYEQFLASVGE